MLTEEGLISRFHPKFSNDDMKEIIAVIRLLMNDSSNSIKIDWNEIRNDATSYHCIWGKPFEIYRSHLDSLILSNSGILEDLLIAVDDVGKVCGKKLELNGLFGDSSTNLEWTGSYFLRSAAYVHIANTSRIDYYPDTLRVPYIASYLNRMYNYLPKELYQKVSNCLELDINKIDLSTKSTTFPIPPFTAIVLNEARSLDEIPFTLLDLRHDFASFRIKLSEVDNVLKTCHL